MMLERLLAHVKGIKKNFKDSNIESISTDSRKTKPESLFIAWKGVNTDSNQFIEDAIEKGAKAVVGESDVFISEDIPYLRVQNGREAYSIIAQNFFGNPSEHIDLIGITGTTGKTTIAFLIYSILNDLGIKSGLIGTSGCFSGSSQMTDLLHGPVTTPEPMELNQLFSKMVKDRCKVVIMECSSFGLEQKRLFGLDFQIGILSNLSYNHHINYHGGIQGYIRAKEQLFKQIKKDGIGIINRDTEYFNDFHINNATIKTVGIQECANFKIQDFYQSEEAGISFSIQVDETSYLITSPLSGFYQTYNLSQAFAGCLAYGLEPQKIIKSISQIKAIPGRWHFLETDLPFSILIDKANTPIALRNILPLLESKGYKKRILVFGNVGGGDSTERRIMAKLFFDSFHEMIITTDDPEQEDPMEGALDFLAGIQIKESSGIKIELDRKKAIQLALNKAKSGDLVAILGRGNQREFIGKDKTTEFDDIEVTKEILKELENKLENPY